MFGGRPRAGFASLFVSFLWLITLLSVLEWSVASARPSDVPQIRSAVSVLAAPAGEAPDPIVYVQLPAPPAVAEKRPSASAGSAKGGADGTSTVVPPVPSPELDADRAANAPAAIGVPKGPVLAHAGARAPPRIVPVAPRA